jgi:hypothetical protein
MRVLINVALAISLLSPAVAQELPKGVTAANLATNNKLFLELARKGLKWEEPEERPRLPAQSISSAPKDSAPF